jgi:hypothetical protein
MTAIKEYQESKVKKLTAREKEKEGLRKEPLDYEQLSKNIEVCEFCKQKFHPSGLHKHKLYCKQNPNRKEGYTNKRKWTCKHCEDVFDSQQARDLHQKRCNKKNIELDQFDKLRMLKDLFPDIYKILSNDQVRNFLDGELE